MLCIGKVLKSNGTDGELLVSFLDVNPQDIDLQEPVFIEFDGLPVPFYFESFNQRGNNRALVRLTGVRSLKDADELAGSADLEDIPGNTCLWVRKADGTEVLLPFHEDLLLEADPEKQILILQIPEGILDL